MDSLKLKELIAKKEVQDYTYLILFLLVFAFFAFFVIRPVLSVGVTLRKEAADLRVLNATFDDNIRSVIKIQSELESIRDKKYLIDQALPAGPSTGPIILQIESAAGQTGIEIKKLVISDVTYKSIENSNGKLQSVDVDLTASGNFAQINDFIKLLYNQRRLKFLPALKVTRSVDILDNSLEIIIKLSVYYI